VYGKSSDGSYHFSTNVYGLGTVLGYGKGTKSTTGTARVREEYYGPLRPTLKSTVGRVRNGYRESTVSRGTW